MNSRTNSLSSWLLVGAFLLTSPIASAQTLNVPQEYQSQTNWCWAASSQAVLAYYAHGATTSQADIAAYAVNGANVPNCLYGSCNGYHPVDSILNWFARLGSHADARSLSFTEAQTEMGASRPVFVRWGWDGTTSGHLVVLRGVSTDPVTQSQQATLMDPWYGPTVSTYAWVVSGSGHTWTDSLRLNNEPGPGYSYAGVTQCGYIGVWQALNQPGSSTLWSCDGRFFLSMQGDGNLVLYHAATPWVFSGAALWGSNTQRQYSFNYSAVFQSDGNFVMYDAYGNPQWHSNTWMYPNASLVLQTDGNVVIYTSSGKPVWATNTAFAYCSDGLGDPCSDPDCTNAGYCNPCLYDPCSCGYCN